MVRARMSESTVWVTYAWCVCAPRAAILMRFCFPTTHTQTYPDLVSRACVCILYSVVDGPVSLQTSNSNAAGALRALRRRC